MRGQTSSDLSKGVFSSFFAPDLGVLITHAAGFTTVYSRPDFLSEQMTSINFSATNESATLWCLFALICLSYIDLNYASF